MRKLVVLAAVAAFALVGCARLMPQPAPAPDHDVLYLRTSQGVTLVDPLAEGEAVHLDGAVPSIDWSTVVGADRTAGWTRVAAVDSDSRSELWSRDVYGKLEVKVASADGELVALGYPSGDAGYPEGRSSTTLTIVDQALADTREITLRGNYEPEAFSTDGQSLFVVEYVPPEKPEAYRVRRLDLRTERVVGVYTPDEELQEAMQGTARVQAASPDGRRLYTLYSIDGGDHAFIHVLSLDELWAHCIDLPSGFGTRSERAMALSVSPDGRRLYVADGASDTIAEIDTEALSVTRTTQLAFGSAWAVSNAAYGPDGTLYLASSQRVSSLDAETFSEGRSWDLGEKVTGLQAAADGSQLYVGLRDGIAVLDTETGARLGTLRPNDVGRIEQLGESTRTLEEERRVVSCAC